MPEAEDVLLEAAQRATVAVRSVWERHREEPDRDGRAPSNARTRRLVAWQVAWVGRSWPVVAVAPRPKPGFLGRRLRGLPPWVGRSGEAPFTDGRQIWMPLRWLEASVGTDAADRALVATLGLARRLARNAACDRSDGLPLSRDLWWLAEGVLGDAALATAWPGLAPALAALRRRAIAGRPGLAGLRPAERIVEIWLRELLASPPGESPERLAKGLDPDADPARVADFAAARAASLEAEGYRGIAPVAHWGVYHPSAEQSPGGRAPGARPRSRRPGRGRRLGRPLVRRVPLPGERERQGPFVLPFSDPHLTVDDAGALPRPTDRGSDEDLETLSEELARLEGLTVVRDDAAVREVLEDGGGPAGPADPVPVDGSGERVWLYPEWDAERGAYRDPGCRVRELRARGDDGGWSQRALAARQTLLTRLRRQLQSLRPRRQRLCRQADGDDLDLAAWVDDWADRRAGGTPAGRVYSQERALRRDVAVTLLLDVSGSTESWLSGQERVIDVVKQSALVFAEALASLGDRFELLAFSGQGAGDVRVRVLKRLGEATGAAVQCRIGALEPDAFTRLGGALRHATSSLARAPARIRLLLLLSDGKPQDEDGYEGGYGIEDVRQAVAEARLQGVRVFAITVDREGPVYLPRLFGPHGYTVIWDAEALPERLPGVYRRLTGGA